MRRTAVIAGSLLALLSASVVAQAQDRPLRLNVKPRSWLDVGNAVAPYSAPNPASAQGQMISYYVNPPWQNMRDRFGEGVLPDAFGGPFVGAQNVVGPVNLDPFWSE